LNELIINVKQKMSFSDEVEEFYLKIEQIHKNFTEKLVERFPGMTENDYRLIKLLRLGFTSKEIAPLLNISTKSVEMNRYRLRKKLGLEKGTDLIQFINQI
jgi:PiT family inorganic phosphate transporter